jgi:hypothetical protein
MLKESPILKMFFVLQGMIPRRTTFEFDYLGEFEMEIKNILGQELGAHMRLIHEKNQRPKISCYCTFKAQLATTGKRKPQGRSLSLPYRGVTVAARAGAAGATGTNKIAERVSKIALTLLTSMIFVL